MRWKLVTLITIWATNWSNLLLKSRGWSSSFSDYKGMPAASLGRQFWLYMTQHQISFKPNLIRHDIKHVLLGYDMKMPDELKIHAFLVGNRSYNLMGMAYLMICTCIVPEILPALRQEYHRGRQATCLKSVNLESYLQADIHQVRQSLKIQ